MQCTTFNYTPKSMKSQVRLNIQKNIPLAPLTTFKIGGPAKFFVEVSDEKALLEALQYARENSLKIFVLGGGSNILVSDEGFDGLVIKITTNISKQKINAMTSDVLLGDDDAQRRTSAMLECWAGESLSGLVNFARDNSLSGLEWAAGIPGTVGGAVRGNAGAYGGCMADCVESVKILKITNDKYPRKIASQSRGKQILNELQITNYKLQKCKFAYRDSIFKQSLSLIILSCVLKLQKGDKAEIEARMKDVIGKRTQKIPIDPSAGSFFKNPIIKFKKEILDIFERDQGEKSKDGKVPAGWLIAEAGLLGKKMGGAVVSEEHGNFVVNCGDAKAQDVVMLSSFIKRKVRDEFGVQLMEEVQYVGF